MHIVFSIALWAILFLRPAFSDVEALPYEILLFWEAYQMDNSVNGKDRNILKGVQVKDFDDFVAKISTTSNYHFTPKTITNPQDIEGSATQWRGAGFDIRFKKTSALIDGQSWDASHAQRLRAIADRIQSLRRVGNFEPDSRNPGSSPVDRVRRLAWSIQEARLNSANHFLIPNLQDKKPDFAKDFVLAHEIKQIKIGDRKTYFYDYLVIDGPRTVEKWRKEAGGAGLSVRVMQEKITSLMFYVDDWRQARKGGDGVLNPNTKKPEFHWPIILEVAKIRGEFLKDKPC